MQFLLPRPFLKHGVLISLISSISFKNAPCKTSEARLDAQIKFVAPDDKLRFFSRRALAHRGSNPLVVPNDG